MSWMKRRGLKTPSPAPAPSVPMYNPNQHSSVQETQWQNQQLQNTWYQRPQQMQYQLTPNQGPQIAPQQQNHWQQPQHLQQQPFNAQLFHQQQYPYYQHTPQNQPHQQMGAYQNNTGYDQQVYENLEYNQLGNQNEAYENYSQNAKTTEQPGDAWGDWGWVDEDNSNLQTEQSSSISQASEKLGNAPPKDESWNWPAEDTKPFVAASSNALEVHEPSEAPKSSQQSHTIKTETISPVPDHLRLEGKRGKLDTPQWSTESQQSQESSDDVLHTSESDKSRMMSRSSTISHSPISGQEPIPQNTAEETPVKREPYENKEIVSNMAQEKSLPPKGNPTPPPPQNLETPSLISPGASDDTKNPYKRATGLTHKAANQSKTANITSSDSRQAFQPNNFHGHQVNLEAPPDNSEQPDRVPSSSQTLLRVKPVTNLPDNNEAPINDRNQYLETGHLSESNMPEFSREVELTSMGSDPLPPPGLRRMVTGQMEQNEGLGSVGSFGDEPPPGLSRMVLGQTETVECAQMTNTTQNVEETPQFDSSGPPEGLRRMIPGESSSPESSSRVPPPRREDNDSEPEFDRLSQHAPQPRSATIGADTPPIGNPPSSQSSNGHRPHSVVVAESQTRGSTASLADKAARQPSKEKDSSRRDSIEGETQETDISNLTSSVRNLTVGENLTDGQTSNVSLPEPEQRRPSRQESSDSDRDDKRPLRSSRDKRSSERSKRDRERGEKGRDRDRYTPESYHDKKYDRRYKNSHYEEDTDYLSDKDKDRRIREVKTRDYDRKYSSLRKEKDRDRRRRDPRDPRDPRDYRRDDYHYRARYEDDYENEGRSRPSSRSDPLQDLYRERILEKDQRDRRPKDRENRERYSRRPKDPRDMYNPYQSFSYDPYNPFYQYYENLRRTNPQAYAEWYRKYYPQAASHNSSYGCDDRASVHSGRSSANDEHSKDRYTRQSFYSQLNMPHMGSYYGETHAHSVSSHYGLDTSSFSRPFDQTDSSLNLADTSLTSQRMTPAKFATAHSKGSISSGKLVRFLPNYSMDGLNATVEICLLPPFLFNDDEYREMSLFPGPLVKGVTHKKTIIEYCENKIRDAGADKKIVDVDSYVLMWELLMLLIRQNGMVVGTDIAELLLKSRREVPPPRPSSSLSSISSNNGEVNPISESSAQHISENTGSLLSIVKEEEVTKKFREFLLYGSGKEALEWAMKHGLWGHALFLASKLDKRTYANVMMRFANGLTLNDPLQTLYQLLSGKMPAAVTCVSEEKWGDWRPHLAMILSNSTQRPELNRKAITMMGDTLLGRGSLYAAQFCYLMAEVGFGKHDDADSRLVLLGADHTKTYPGFASNEAIHMTEIYEYACGLNDSEFVIPQFQLYKYLLATRLADRGLLEKSLAYLEQISTCIVANPTLVHASFVDNVYNLADRLKFYDPIDEVEEESEFGAILDLDSSRLDHSWLKDLRAIQTDYQNGMITHQSMQNLDNFAIPTAETESAPTYGENPQSNWQQYDQQQQQQKYQQPPWQTERPQQSTPMEYQQPDNQNVSQSGYNQQQYQEQQNNYWEGQQQQWADQVNQYNKDNIDQQNHYGLNTEVEPKEVEKDVLEESTQPQITMPNQSNYERVYDETPEETHAKGSPEKKSTSPAKKVQSPTVEKTQSTGWFGGIFSKLAIKPKNQMKLPDDKNPKIVWDQEKKKWINVDEDPNDTVNELKPPPKMSDLMQKSVPPTQNPAPAPRQSVSMYQSGSYIGQPNLSTGTSEPALLSVGREDSSNNVKPNMFKLQRGRGNLKNSYIDVFNPGGKASGPTSLLAPDQFTNTSGVPNMNFFIPQSVVDPNTPVDFLTPGGVPHIGEQQAQ